MNYIVTSNHYHLLVVDDGDRDVIPRSIQLIAGRTGQKYNQRKNRKGAFWEDRYHATAVERGDHLIRCLVYIDLNMVRSGVVDHPSKWPFSGYNEIQEPRRKYILIDYKKLRELHGIETHDLMKAYHRRWVEEYLGNGNNVRDDKWSSSIAVGSRGFAKKVKVALGVRAKGRRAWDGGEAYQLREPSISYGAHFWVKNEDIGIENTYFWSNNYE